MGSHRVGHDLSDLTAVAAGAPKTNSPCILRDKCNKYRIDNVFHLMRIFKRKGLWTCMEPLYTTVHAVYNVVYVYAMNHYIQWYVSCTCTIQL